MARKKHDPEQRENFRIIEQTDVLRQQIINAPHEKLADLRDELYVLLGAKGLADIPLDSLSEKEKEKRRFAQMIYSGIMKNRRNLKALVKRSHLEDADNTLVNNSKPVDSEVSTLSSREINDNGEVWIEGRRAVCAEKYIDGKGITLRTLLNILQRKGIKSIYADYPSLCFYSDQIRKSRSSFIKNIYWGDQIDKIIDEYNFNPDKNGIVSHSGIDYIVVKSYAHYSHIGPRDLKSLLVQNQIEPFYMQARESSTYANVYPRLTVDDLIKRYKAGEIKLNRK